jgi:hypothetical protein
MQTQNADSELVRDLIHGRWRSQILNVALRLGLLDAVGDEPRSAADLAAELCVSGDGLGRLLRLLAALGVLEADGDDRFRATGASRLLRRDHPMSLGAEARHALAPWTAIAWGQLESSIRDGAGGFARGAGMPLFSYLAGHPDEAAVFQDFQTVQVRRNFEALAEARAFPTSGTIVDVGGGSGAMLRALLTRTPDLRGVLYDRPEAIAQAAPDGDRLELVAGDFFESVPAGAETYLLSHVLHDWPDADAVRLLRSVGAGMRDDSALLLVENLPAGGRMGIVFGYLDLLMFTATGGRERTTADHSALLEAAGLGLESERQVDRRTGLSVLTARRRAHPEPRAAHAGS